MKNITFYILLFLTSVMTQAQNGQNMNVKLDSLGNAQFTMDVKLSAQQWDVWNSSYGSNPAMIKRELERSMPAYFLDNFKLEKNDMERSFRLGFVGYGVCEIDKKGKWIINTDQKNAQITEMNASRYMLVTQGENNTPGAMMNLQFPKEAKKIKQDKDAFGNVIFTFIMEENHSKPNYLMLGGFAFIILGIAGFIWKFIQK
ncbi:MAG: hypothetical protein Q4G27_10530 [Flavobacteriaceae bacterium]|nr:hypothetical protein [Flavobacteriaceae bacterium]